MAERQHQEEEDDIKHNNNPQHSSATTQSARRTITTNVRRGGQERSRSTSNSKSKSKKKEKQHRRHQQEGNDQDGDKLERHPQQQHQRQKFRDRNRSGSNNDDDDNDEIDFASGNTSGSLLSIGEGSVTNSHTGLLLRQSPSNNGGNGDHTVVEAGDGAASMVGSISATASTSSLASTQRQRKNWTRSLSPKRTVAELHDSFQNLVISPAVNSIRKLRSSSRGKEQKDNEKTTRTKSWSQSPISRGHYSASNIRMNAETFSPPPLTLDCDSKRDGLDAVTLALAAAANRNSTRDGTDAVSIALAAAANRHKNKTDLGRPPPSASANMTIPPQPTEDDRKRSRSASRGIGRSKSDSYKNKPSSSSSTMKKQSVPSLEALTYTKNTQNNSNGTRRGRSSSQSRRSHDHRHRHHHHNSRETKNRRQTTDANASSNENIHMTTDYESTSKEPRLPNKMHHSVDTSDKPNSRNRTKEGTNAQHEIMPTIKRQQQKDDDGDSDSQDDGATVGSTETPPPRKPSSDPGLSAMLSFPKSKRTSGNKSPKIPPPSTDIQLPSSQHIKKPASDPGLTVKSSPISLHHHPSRKEPKGMVRNISSSGAPALIDRIPNPRKPAGTERRNLDRESLKHVQDVKDSIRQMRMERLSQRRKVKFDGPTPSSGTATGATKSSLPPTTTVKHQSSHAPSMTTKSKTTSQALKSSTNAYSSLIEQSLPVIEVANSSSSSLLSSQRTDSRHTLPNKQKEIQQHQRQQHLHSSFNTSSSRLGGITMDDLEVGHLKKIANNSSTTITGHSSLSSIPTSPSSRQSPSNHSKCSIPNHGDTSNKSGKKSFLTTSIKRTKKLVKRTCRDVWTERDEIVHLQRKNWSIRKSLLNMEVPQDSVTALNLKLEKALRKERETTLNLDKIRQEKSNLEEECTNLTKKVSEFTTLLDSLNTQVVPLLPSMTMNDSIDSAASEGMRPPRTGVESQNKLPPGASGNHNYVDSKVRAAALLMNLLDPDEFSDSIDSTEDDIHCQQEQLDLSEER